MSKKNTNMDKFRNDSRSANYAQSTELEHIHNQTGMYLGTKEVSMCSEYVFDEKTKKITKQIVEISPAALKCFDEIIVNAIDQNTKNVIAKKKKCDIWVDINIDEKKKSMVIFIENNNSCVPVCIQTTTDGREMYTPQFIFGEFRTSSQFKNKTNNSHGDIKNTTVTGGVYGTGAKAVNAFSKYFSVETWDDINKVHYFQSWENKFQQTNEPEIEDADNTKPKTKFEFELNLEDFEMTTIKRLRDFEKMAYMRTLHTAIFTGSRVYWNGDELKYKIPDVIKMHNVHYNLLECPIIGDNGLKWNIGLATHDGDNGMEYLSIMNGIFIRLGGTHIDFIVDQVMKFIKEDYLKLAKKNGETKPKFLTNRIKKYMFVSIIGQIDHKAFSGQRKDSISASSKNYSGFKIPENILNSYWKSLKPLVESSMITKTKIETSNKTTKKRVKAKKYTKAKFAGTNKKQKCSLFLAEGDSAISTIDTGISNKHTELNYDYYGIFSVQGVIPNIRKKIKWIVEKKTGDKYPQLHKDILKSERLMSLFSILGLDVNNRYDDIKDIEKLNYGCVIIATDQDEDGKGNIRSNIINMFQTLWPNLVSHGFIKFIKTPVIRAFHKTGRERVIEFYSEQKYHEWVETVDDSKYEIVYYKGLASHGNKEVINIFKNWKNILYQITSDNYSEILCEVYFGKNADLRKKALSSPSVGTEEDFYTNDYKLNLSHHLNSDTRQYQKYNCERHIPHEIDGLTPSKRKITYGSMKKFKNNNSREKIYQLGGYITQNMNYHHGDASLNGTMIKMAQTFVGATQYPFLRELSKFGSRKFGGSDAGQPRYIYTKLNKVLTEAMFPWDDEYILRYTYDDGSQGEPVFMVPIICLPILDNYISPGHGWATKKWGRDYNHVSEHLKDCIKAGEYVDIKEDYNLSEWNIDHTITLNTQGNEQSTGDYERRGDIITITELPLLVWGNNLINGKDEKKTDKMDNDAMVKSTKDKQIPRYKSLIDNPHVKNVTDYTDGNDIKIEIEFEKGAVDKIMGEYGYGDVDPMIHYLDLTQSLTPTLCFMTQDKTVKQYAEYKDVFKNWFGVRLEYYHLRIERMLILLKLRILRLENKIRFAENRNSYTLNEVDEKDQVFILSENKYIKLHDELLKSPKYTEVSQLEELILRSPKISYKYLLTMNSYDFNNKGVKTMKDKLKKYKQELKELSHKDIIKKTWLKELTTLDNVIKTAREQGWDHWDVKPKW